MNETLIDIRDLKKYYPVKGGIFRRHIADVKAVDGIDLKVKKGECLGLVGESGCGKTTLGKTLLNIHKATSGRIYFDKDAELIEELENLINGNAADTRLSPKETEDKIKVLRKNLDMTQISRENLRKLRRRLQLVFQDPSNSLNPRMLVKKIIAEPLVCQKLLKASEISDKVIEILGTVGLAREHLNRYPHEFSGGQRQRIAVARALITQPDMILMDEPTSALDVSVQAQILNLLKKIQKDFQLKYIFLTHHLIVLKFISDRIAVMYLGKIVETGKTKSIFEKPLHPYTQALLSAIPIPDPETKKEKIILEGDVPNPLDPPAGCRFHPRCPKKMDICSKEMPVLEDMGEEHQVACWLHKKR